MEPTSSTNPMANDSECNQVDTTTKDSEKIKGTVDSKNQTFLRHLNTAFQNISPQLPEHILNATYVINYKPSEVEKFVNDYAVKSEESVYRKMQDNPDFVKATNWCKIMHTAGMRNTSNKELPLALKTIAVTERFPPPSQAKGVNFKQLYMNLSNMMLGYPVHEMNAATAKVLKDVYEETVAELKRADVSDFAETVWSQNFLNSEPSTTENLSHEGPAAFFTDRNLNPMQIPFDKLFYSTKANEGSFVSALIQKTEQ
ncbi:uncharacterized protein LOC134211069 [Armigeres subalbatus]|uniref:uncharacterized protein LOC134211069 n=1 Tax=Armigeres subalbatus TaxID=124917 RepID=UPI002ED6B66D